MIKLRPSLERGHANHGWLDSFHTFSFADYHDPAHMGFRSLRVINEDRVAGGEGFGMHPHRDMEIVTLVLEGALAHKDSMGNASVIQPGEVQRMSAGTGVTHSEFNHSKTEPVHLFQVWILPSAKGLKPGYEQKAFALKDRKNKIQLVASSDGAQGSVTIHQDAQIYVCALDKGQKVSHMLKKGRGAWVQVKSGQLNINGSVLNEGDGAAIEDESTLEFRAEQDTDLLLFDLR